MKKFRVALTALAFAIGTLLFSPAATPAHAASAYCSGSLVDSQSMGSDHWVNVYWNSSTKRNCAQLFTDIRTPHSMSVSIQTCEETNPAQYCTPGSEYDADSGNYSYYAGPVSVYAGNHCIYVFAYAEYNGDSWGANSESMRGNNAAFC